MATITTTPAGIAPNANKGRRDLPQIPANDPFIYAFHPDRWTVDQGHLVPVLQPISQTPGINGVTDDGDMTICFAEAERRGWRRIPYDVDGPNTSYCVSVEVEGGKHYMDRWTVAHPGTSRTTHIDKGLARVRWLRSLVDRGIVDPCPLYILEQMRATREASARRYQDRARLQPSASGRADLLATELEVINAAIDEAVETGAPAPAAADTPLTNPDAPGIEQPPQRSRTRK